MPLKRKLFPSTIEETYLEGNTKKTRNYVVDTDEGPRADTAIDKLAKLRPSIFSWRIGYCG